MSTTANKDLDTFDNGRPDRDYTIHIETSEFTCLCPKTGQPDFATIKIDYIPHLKCVELKSFKLYMWTYREVGAFHEVVTNQILDDLVAATEPKFMRVTGIFNVRGGVYTNVVAEHRKPGWQMEQLVQLPPME